MEPIYKKGNYRILVQIDQEYTAETDLEQDLINRYGAWFYVLEKWNPKVDEGWLHVDCCTGFLGPVGSHYIVEEFIALAESDPS